MTRVVIESLVKTFGRKAEVRAIDDVSIEIEAGELLVLLGPSGCGKTTILRSVAGLETPDEGQIQIGEAVVYDAARRVDLAPEDRDLGMVFQSYALWPNKTVRQNIEFPLKARKMRHELAAGTMVDEAAAMVDCSALLDRYPNQLSGGQQQRVAVARGIVSHPRVVLMDEPLSNLDARLRDQVRGELNVLHKKLGFTGIYVTHDQTEALALGDRLAVMRQGKIEQIGTAIEVFETPASPYVAEFVGYLNGVDLPSTEQTAPALSGGAEGLTGRHVRFRPRDAVVAPLDDRPADSLHLVGAVVHDVAYMGAGYEVQLEYAGAVLRAEFSSAGSGIPAHIQTGSEVTVAIDHSHLRAFPL